MTSSGVEPAVQAVFWAVVAGRFLLPLLIPRFPLPAVLACLVLDAADQTIFQSFGYDPPFYQGYDKAMDIFYLSIAYMAGLRNWTNLDAVKVLRFLFFYRLIGATLFELTQIRALLLIFPNTFEYFFIAYELVRLRRDPARYAMRFWVLVAAAIWVFIKLPQEYWIHIAKLDFTDTVTNVPWFGPAVVIGLVALAAIFWFVVRPRLDPPDWGWHWSADPLPTAIDEADERDAFVAKVGRVFSEPVLEKVLLVGLISVIYAQVLPGVRSTPLQLFVGVTVFVVLNAAFGLWTARHSFSLQSALLSFLAVFALNTGLVVLGGVALNQFGGTLQTGTTLFFVFLFSLLTTLYDRFRPVHDWRRRRAELAATAPVALEG